MAALSQISRFRSKRGGVFKSAFALLTFIGAGGVLSWMLLMPNVVEIEIETRTGFPVEAKALAINPFGLSLNGEDVLIGNPDSYGGGEAMLSIESLLAEASLPALGRGEIWIYSMELHISRAVLVVDERGRLNLDAFANTLFSDPETGTLLPFFAENVRLLVDEVVFVDNSRVIPSRRQIRASLDTERTDLDNARDIFSPLFDLAKSVGSLPVQ